VLSRCTS
ncbi:DNA polymerase III, subunit gamma and tau, partial [Chlamydia psittaci 84-8471/1]